MTWLGAIRLNCSSALSSVDHRLACLSRLVMTSVTCIAIVCDSVRFIADNKRRAIVTVLFVCTCVVAMTKQPTNKNYHTVECFSPDRTLVPSMAFDYAAQCIKFYWRWSVEIVWNLSTTTQILNWCEGRDSKKVPGSLLTLNTDFHSLYLE